MNKGKTPHNAKIMEEVKESSESDKNDNNPPIGGNEEKETKEGTNTTGFSEVFTSLDELNKIVEKEDDTLFGVKKAEDITDSSNTNNDNEKEENKKEVKEDKSENVPVVLLATPEHVEQADVETAEEDVDAKNLPAGRQGSGVAKEEIAGEATFKKGTNSKKSLTLIVILIVAVTLVLFARTDEGKKILATIGLGGEPAVLEKYINPIHKYAFEFETDENSQLVVADNIPVELGSKVVESMQDLELTDGDALLIRTDNTSGDNIVYTVRKGYTAIDEYLEDIRIGLGDITSVAGTEYIEKESIAGKEKLSAVEFSFEMDVLIDQESMETYTGIFYDTVFEAGDNVYSISFGYSKDIKNAKYYVDSYYDLVASFTYDEEVEFVSDDLENTETEIILEEDEIEVVE